MMMKRKKSSKKIIAVILALVIVLTSLPFMLVGAIGEGSYNPAPYWGDGSNEAAANTTFVATLNADGSVKVSFPHAQAASTWNTYSVDNPTKKSITNYIFEITRLDDDGNHEAIWTENIDVSKSTTPAGGTFTVDNSEGNDLPNSIYYMPGAFTSLEGYNIESSYDVSIRAVDSDGWVSDAIHTLLTETPYYIINDDFSPNESWVVREMMLFNEAGNAQILGDAQSGGGASDIDYVVTNGSKVNVDGHIDGMGYNGGAYRFWINGTYDTPYSMQTTWSRSHYNFTGAEEVWFYVDFTRANVPQVAFNLSANEKWIGHFRDGKFRNYDGNVDGINGASSNYGETFSTAAVGQVDGVNNYGTLDNVYIQNADGLWEETSMNNGYLTGLSGYEGFVRIPIEYFILQKDQYITSNAQFKSWVDCNNDNDESLLAYCQEVHIKANDKVVVGNKEFVAEADSSDGIGNYRINVNPAGTKVTEAVIVYDRYESYGSWGSKKIYGLSMLGCYDTSNITHTTNDAGGTTMTMEDPLYAIEDLVSAGVQVANWSTDAVHKSFYIDQVMFCKKNVGTSADFDSNGYVLSTSSLAFPSETSISNNQSGTYGIKMSGFYDRTKEVPKAIAQYIMQYSNEIPSLNDLAVKEMIDAIILEYIECFDINTTGLSDEGKIEAALTKINSLGHTDAYNRYQDIEEVYGFVHSSDAASNYNAVVYFETEVEKLPTGEFADHTDANMQSKLKQLMAIYETFNLSHHALLGAEAETKFLELYDLVMGEEVKTGQSIGAYPFIPFNDFEKGYTYGQLSDMYHDDYPANQDSKATDVNSTGNFTTYTSSKVISQAGMSADARAAGAIGWSPADFRPTGETIDGSAGTYFSRMDAQITNKGFADSLGATININGSLNSSSSLVMATLSTTYKGAEANTWANLPGLDLSALALKTDTTNGTDAEDVTRYGEGVIPNSFVMYVDFTNVQTINMNIKFILSDSSGNDINCFFCGGDISQTPVIYQLNENGEWEAQNLQASQVDQNGAYFSDEGATALCTIAPSSLNKLEGYKGFIRIPLSNFRIPDKSGLLGATVGAHNLDNILDDGYKIKQAKITFWDYTGANAGKDITIDALGFTYDPTCTNRLSNNTDCNGELNQDNGLSGNDMIKNMDAYFKVKTVDSNNFEKMVSTIDPYASEAEFKASYDACNSAYLALSDYQKSIPEVEYCREVLFLDKYRDLYIDYANEIVKEQWNPYYTATAEATALQQLQTDVAEISAVAKAYSVDDESIRDLYDNYRENYLEKLGFESIEEAVEVVTIYEKGLHRLSVTERNSFMYSDGATPGSGLTDDYIALSNAYNAAKRAILIGGDASEHEGVDKDGIIANVETFKTSITGIYGNTTHSDDDADRIPDTEDSDGENRAVSYKKTIQVVNEETGATETVNALEYYTEMYEDISVFGKLLLSADDDINTAYMNMYDAAEAIHDNSTAITPNENAGDVVPGGIITYENRMKAAKDDVSAKIAAKTVLDTATLNEVEYCLGQYEVLLRRYALVDELNEAYADLALLLPVAEMQLTDSGGTVITEVNLNNNGNTSATAKVDMTYVAVRQNRNVDLYVKSDLTWTLTEGAGLAGFEHYNYSAGGATVTGTGDDITAVVGSFTNGDSTTLSDYEYEISVDPTLAANVPMGAKYTDTVTFYAIDPALVDTILEYLQETNPDASANDALNYIIENNMQLDTEVVTVNFESTNGPEPPADVFTVTIPTNIPVEWDTTDDVSVAYTVDAQLSANAKLTVDIADETDTPGKLTATGTDVTIAYISKGFDAYEFTGTVSGATSDPVPAVQVEQEAWDAAPVGNYKTTLTYTVVYSNSSTS